MEILNRGGKGEEMPKTPFLLGVHRPLFPWASPICRVCI